MSTVCVALDPGHGSCGDPGCDGAGAHERHWGVVRGNDGVDRLIEKDWVLELGFILANRLGHLPGVQPVLTRDEDRDLGLTEAAVISEKHGADIVLCLHVNAYTDPHERGLRTFYLPGELEAKAIADTIAQHAPMQLRGVNPRPRIATVDQYPAVVNVLMPFAARKMCAVLVECGFASNAADRAFLITDAGKQAVANAIEAGVIEFWQSRSVKHAV
jgi:N-acetylmuramoyl-L-alanine amidase